MGSLWSAAQDNTADQFNPSHTPTGPGYRSGYQGTGTKTDLDNHSRQMNPQDAKYQGYLSGYQGTGTKADLDNHSRQMNPQDVKYPGKRW